MKPKLAVILYKSKTLSNGEHPLMLRVTHRGQRKYVSLKLSCPAHLWDEKRHTPKRTHPNKDFIKALIDQKLRTYQVQLLDHSHQTSSPAALIKAVESPKQSTAFFPFLEELIVRFEKSGRIGNANIYKDTLRILRHFIGQTPLQFSDIDPKFLSQFEVFLRSKNLADTTLFTYFKTLRAIFNKAIQEGLSSEGSYPFKVFSVSKFNTSTQKRAITKAEMNRLSRLTLCPTGRLYTARQYFLFSYYGQGMNFRDMAFLRWQDIIDGRVFYRRAKTKKQLQFKLLAPAVAIIEECRPLTGDSMDNYVFPILDKSLHVTPLQIDNRLDKVLKQINKCLKTLGKEADIPTHLTMYVARHTYATVLKKSGVSIPVISEAMGHATPVITQTYLKSFEDEVIDEANTFLL